MSGTRQPLRVLLIGWGAVATRVAELISLNGSRHIQIAAVAVRDPTRSRKDLPPGARLIASAADLSGIEADIAVEAASAQAVSVWAQHTLEAGCDLVVTSTSAFCEDGVLTRLVDQASALGRQIVIPAGAVGADVLGAASILRLDRVEHTIVKPPVAWLGTPAEERVDLATLKQPQEFWHGSAREVAERFRQNANAAAYIALAGLGLDDTTVRLVADPSASRNVHRVEVAGAFGRISFQIENEPLATNLKSSETTALSLVRVLENRIRTLVY